MHVRKSESLSPGEREGGREAEKEKLSVASWAERALIWKRIQYAASSHRVVRLCSESVTHSSKLCIW